MNSHDFVKTENPYYQEVILYYKTTACPSSFKNPNQPNTSSEKKCQQQPCYNYHSLDEKRRPIFNDKTQTLTYQAIMCQNVEGQKNCPQSDNCGYCHNSNELNYHPAVYKTEPCSNCKYPQHPKLCPGVHSDETSRKILYERYQSKKAKTTNSHQQQKFDLDTFKTKQCPVKGNHNPKFCPYYHHDKDRRRPPSQYKYSAETCPVTSKNQNCSSGDDCPFCHNKVEQLYHPERYKRKFCSFYPHNIQKCDYGHFCSFAHTPSEIKIELLHNLVHDEYFYLYKYKSVFCPYIYEHDRSRCVYAHNSQDFRRSLLKYDYDAEQCPKWAQGQIYSYEQGGCPKLMDCEKCHGWKEFEYHPLQWKTKPCQNMASGKGCSKPDCPFYHDESEKRNMNVEEYKQQRKKFVSPLKQNEDYTKDIQENGDSKTMYDTPIGKKPYAKKNSNYKSPVMPTQHINGPNDNFSLQDSQPYQAPKQDGQQQQQQQQYRSSLNFSSSNQSEDEEYNNQQYGRQKNGGYIYNKSKGNRKREDQNNAGNRKYKGRSNKGSFGNKVQSTSSNDSDKSTTHEKKPGSKAENDDNASSTTPNSNFNNNLGYASDDKGIDEFLTWDLSKPNNMNQKEFFADRNESQDSSSFKGLQQDPQLKFPIFNTDKFFQPEIRFDNSQIGMMNRNDQNKQGGSGNAGPFEKENMGDIFSFANFNQTQSNNSQPGDRLKAFQNNSIRNNDPSNNQFMFFGNQGNQFPPQNKKFYADEYEDDTIWSEINQAGSYENDQHKSASPFENHLNKFMRDQGGNEKIDPNFVANNSNGQYSDMFFKKKGNDPFRN